jgi:hypothetical protein
MFGCQYNLYYIILYFKNLFAWFLNFKFRNRLEFNLFLIQLNNNNKIKKIKKK